MTPGLSLNTAHAHTWAAVVSGTAWKRHTLGGDGLLTAEYTRGPVIVWASTPGEAKALAPAGPSALEVQIDRLNTAQVFERFKWAARGAVRHSIRWKTGKRPKRSRKLEALADLRYSAYAADKRAANQQGLSPYLPAKTARAKREARQSAEDEWFKGRLRELAPAWFDEDMQDGWDKTYFEVLDRYRSASRKYEAITMREAWRNGLLHDLLTYALLLKDMAMSRRVIRIVKQNARVRAEAAIAHILEGLERRRTHLARRVKPAPRRHRIRRPLYAQPRPPSAPLAPPVS